MARNRNRISREAIIAREALIARRDASEYKLIAKPTAKTLEDYFKDWHYHVFSYGYGTGEEHIIPALKTFLKAFPDSENYDYRELEEAVTPTVAWLFINILAQCGMITYGTSTRFGWLTESGKALRAFCVFKTPDALYDLTADCGLNGYIPCSPTACYCGVGGGYELGRVCQNPFFI